LEPHIGIDRRGIDPDDRGARGLRFVRQRCSGIDRTRSSHRNQAVALGDRLALGLAMATG
jgi:hypothetical protein